MFLRYILLLVISLILGLASTYRVRSWNSVYNWDYNYNYNRGYRYGHGCSWNGCFPFWRRNNRY